jgi:DNA-binding transcriptional regulator YdaS (Cro superfamily)
MGLRFPSASQRALSDELATHVGRERLLARLAGVVHRTQVWRFATGRRRPDVKAATALDAATDGRVPASGWATAREIASVERAMARTEDADQPTGTDGAG